MNAVLTTFDRSAAPINLLTVADWRTFAKAVWPKVERWEVAARRYAAERGGAMVLRADDTLVVFTRLAGGAGRKASYKPGAWRWA